MTLALYSGVYGWRDVNKRHQRSVEKVQKEMRAKGKPEEEINKKVEDMVEQLKPILEKAMKEDES